MATSGTTSFNLNIDDVITEGYERCGLVSNSGYDMRSARRSLDLLFELKDVVPDVAINSILF